MNPAFVQRRRDCDKTACTQIVRGWQLPPAWFSHWSSVLPSFSGTPHFLKADPLTYLEALSIPFKPKNFFLERAMPSILREIKSTHGNGASTAMTQVRI